MRTVGIRVWDKANGKTEWTNRAVPSFTIRRTRKDWQQRFILYRFGKECANLSTISAVKRLAEEVIESARLANQKER